MIERVRRELLYANAFLFSGSGAVPEPVRTVTCDSGSVKFYANTPNTIICYDAGGQNGFFRECKKHTGRREFVRGLIDDYCRYVYHGDNGEEFGALLKEKLSSGTCLFRFFNMGAGTAGYTRITKFRKTLDSSVIGIFEPYPEWFGDCLLELVQCVWGPLDEYRYCLGAKSGCYHLYNADRSVTTKKVADMLGAPGIVPETEFIRLILDGEERIGVSVATAPGVAPTDAACLGITPEFQRQTLILNVADVICYQRDHRPGNYFVTLKDGLADGVCAFDNDCPTTLLNTPDISFTTYSGCSPLVDRSGLVNRPYLDASTTDRLMELSEREVLETVSDSTSHAEARMLWKRVKKLQAAITASLERGILVLLDRDGWSEKTVERELSGEFGNTYAKLFRDRYTARNCLGEN